VNEEKLTSNLGIYPHIEKNKAKGFFLSDILAHEAPVEV
jgi:hypothetical protein